jgi:hypothetical protein
MPRPPTAAQTVAQHRARWLLEQLGKSRAANEGLFSFMRRVSPTLDASEHMRALVDLAERIDAGERVRAVVATPPRHGKPLRWDTLVTMADGTTKPICKIAVGDRVISGAGRPTEVTAVYDQGKLPVLRIGLRSGRELFAEGSHLLLTATRGWRRADELKAYVKQDREFRCDYLVPLAHATEASSMLTTDEARFLGYIVGDGGVTERGCRWTNVDPVLRAEFARLVGVLGGEIADVDAQTVRVRTMPPTGYRKRSAHGVFVKHDGPRHGIAGILDVHGLQGKNAHEKIVPPAVTAASDDAVAAFIAAYFECDGTRAKRYESGRAGANSSFSSVSRELLVGVHHLLTRLGIRAHLAVKRGTYKGHPHTSWVLTIIDDVEFFERIPVLGAKAGPSLMKRKPSQMRDGVVSVEPSGVDWCLCITVADDESFLANGVVTHNTTTWLLAMVWLLHKHPEWAIAYITYAAELAQSKSYEARHLAQEADVALSKDRANLGEWMTAKGGRFVATGVGGALTGRGFRFVLADDPFKGRAEADSPLIRQRTYEWFNSVAFTRQDPNGTAYVVNATRWHPDDLSGRLVSQGWEYVNLKAIGDDGLALWPEKFPIEWLRQQEAQIGSYEFGALYQGEPRQKGATVFGEPTKYDALPAGGYATSGGMDFAYTVRTWSDFSVLVVLRMYGGVAYVVDVLRERLETPHFKGRALPVMHRHGLSRDPRRPGVQAYIGGTEKGVLDLLKAPDGSQPLYVTPMLAASAGDKFARAQPVAAAWNAGKVQVPSNVGALASLGSPYREMAARDPQAAVPWMQPFLDEVCNFTGVADAHDDQVDALAGAFAPFTVAPTRRDVRNLPVG